MDHTLGLVLSGGGVRGIGHIGAIQALREQDIEPTVVSGSSAGAVVGALYCLGLSTKKMRKFFEETSLLHVNKFAFSKPGFIDTDKFYPEFKKYFKEDDFSILEKKLFVSAVDLYSGKLQVFDSGPLIKPLLASSAFPGLFSPVKINETLYSDGGILDNFPVAPLEGICQVMIGVYTSPLDRIGPEGLKHSVNVLERAIRINYSIRSKAKFNKCQLMINPRKLADYSLLDLKKMDDIYRIGYDAANEALSKIEKDTLFNPVRK